MTTLIWDHTSNINGVDPDTIRAGWGITVSDIVVLAGPNPPTVTNLAQPTNPDTGQPWADEASALAWANAQPAPSEEPQPEPEPPAPRPTIESLQAELNQANADREELRDAIEMLTEFILAPPT